MTERFLHRLAEPVPAAGLAAFRALFGALMVVSVVRFAAMGWIDELILAPPFHFTYLGFDWVEPLGALGTYALFAVMGIAALGLCVGLHTRIAALLFCLTFTYAELIDKASYLNHYYFVSLIAALFVFLPSHATGSLDARRRPALRSEHVPRIAYMLLRAELCLVYFFAGFAKLNSDWLFEAEPLRTWLFARGDTPVFGPLLRQESLAFAMSWGGALFDLGIGPLLLWRRTRRYAYAVAVLFHGAVWALFPIGMFSAIMLVAGTIFFEPDWPRRIAAFTPAVERHNGAATGATTARIAVPVLAASALFLSLQILIPLRFLAYPGNPNWTEEAFRFAWRVMLIEKSGNVEFRVVGERGQELVRPRGELTELQYRMMSTQPDMIHQYAIHLAETRRGSSGSAVRVYADAWAALNGRPSQRLIDPDVDLAAEPRSLAPARFIVPLAESGAAVAAKPN